MNLQWANFEDLLEVYFFGTAASGSAQHLGDLIQKGQDRQLARLLRDYREQAITSRNEIEWRAATDRLMTCCSVMEIASLAGFVPDLQRTDFGLQVLPILENEHVRPYYEEFYPTKLPQLFRCRLAGARTVIEGADAPDLSGWVMAFLDLDRRFMEKLEDRTLLRMLDSFTIQGVRFGDVVELMAHPEELIHHLLLSPSERDVRGQALHELSLFMEFCFDLQKLLVTTESVPLLQSAIWNHYGYWFDRVDEKLDVKLGRALSSFLGWRLPDDDLDAEQAVQAYVADAHAVLEALTSGRYAAPVDTLLKSLLVDSSCS